jgi:hypothetical protein
MIYQQAAKQNAVGTGIRRFRQAEHTLIFACAMRHGDGRSV